MTEVFDQIEKEPEQILLDGLRITSRADAHEYLRQELRLPEWYGANADALYDCLTSMPPASIVIENAWHIEEAMGERGVVLLRVFRDAAMANPGLSVRIL